ncbi:peptidylprolyl isomerase [Pseudogemmatithrix spongiicola]|uniref:peptidylprolyl isomerase n=1 Tax=Pseudogemmatithrix spongiicola TaxID=3062599 RepID=A0AA49JTK4_9BACT|nr:peptidylprolyl isomerase [Gemmatimonadaceae bacterium 'strain 138']WKW14599.1 peptidylprolyl isomerase [Gemmatimonadaceae bacterium 'strain 318']
MQRPPTSALRRVLVVTVAVVLAACAPQAASVAPAPDVPPFTPGVVPDSFVARLTTTKGEVDIIVRRDWAPNGAAQFYEAVATGYYDGARFFRTIRGFVSQFGLAADTAVTARWRTRTIPDDPVTQTNRRGTLVFASGGPNTRTTQMFVNLRDNPRLDGLGFPPIGEVISGLDAVDSLYTGYGDGANAPSQERITREGEAYLAANFPLLDRIVRATVIKAWFP